MSPVSSRPLLVAMFALVASGQMPSGREAGLALAAPALAAPASLASRSSASSSSGALSHGSASAGDSAVTSASDSALASASDSALASASDSALASASDPAPARPEARQRLVLRGSKPVSRVATGDYAGVTPGLPTMPTIRLPRDANKRCYLTWTGFQLLPTGSRVFIQLNRSPARTLQVSPGEIRLVLGDCRAVHMNNLRPLDMRYFDTPVAEARVRWTRRAGATLHVRLKSPAEPTIQEVRLQGWTYVFVTFKHVRAKPAPPAPRRRPASSARPAPPPRRGPSPP